MPIIRKMIHNQGTQFPFRILFDNAPRPYAQAKEYGSNDEYDVECFKWHAYSLGGSISAGLLIPIACSPCFQVLSILPGLPSFDS